MLATNINEKQSLHQINYQWKQGDQKGQTCMNLINNKCMIKFVNEGNADKMCYNIEQESV